MQKTAYSSRPMSKILAPNADDTDANPPNPKGSGVVEKPEEDTLPEKYRGKTPAEIAEMHLNAERRLGQLQNEVGQLRGLVTDLAQIQRPAPTKTEEPEVDVSGDDLIRDPVGSIRKVVKRDHEVADAARQEATLKSQLQQETDALIADFGDLPAIADDADFQSFANRTPGRQRDLQLAATGTGLDQVRAARRLFEDYKDFKELSATKPSEEEPKKKKETPVDRAKSVATEGSGPAGRQSTGETLHEADVLEVLRTNPSKYRSPSYQAKLLSAIREGRYVKN